MRSGRPYEGEFLVGTIDDLMRASGYRELAALVLGMLFILFGFYHLYLFARNPGLRQYLWFGLLTVAIGIYAIQTSQWKHFIDLPFLWHKKIEYVVLYITPMLGMSMIWRMLEYQPRLWARLYQSVFVMLTVLVLLIPNHAVHYLTLTLWQVLAVPAMIGILIQLMWFALGGNREARTVLLGTAIFVATALHDIMVEQAIIDTPLLAHFGFTAMIMVMAASLANHFTAMYNRLESEVAERTRELSEANSQLGEAARVDVLTNILNRRGFAERAEEEILWARRTRRGFALVMADIDKFKLINDEYGHACGDEILVEVARQLSRQLRDIDAIARWGGEEFVLLLPETGIDGGVILAEKLRGLIERHQFYYREHVLNITMTFGVSGYELAMSLDDCLGLADRAMYAGKAAGRNVVKAQSDAGMKQEESIDSGSWGTPGRFDS